MAKLSRDFYERDTLTVSRALLGKYLVRRVEGNLLALRITETEAYVGRIDKACHAYGGKRTPRTETLFAPPGTAYIYLIYGMYHCLNFVTEPEGEPAAVLLRGCEAVAGLEPLSLARFGKLPGELTAAQKKNFLNGPGKICKALSLSRAQNAISLLGDELYICDDPADFGLPSPSAPERPFSIETGPRINIGYAQEAVDFPWRFWISPEKELKK